MPTYTAIAFENLLEPRVRKSYGKQVLNERNEEEKVVEDIEPPPAQANHIFISPALYITPEPAPIPETSSGSLSPSPYLVNHKRRGGGEAFANRKLDGLEEAEQVNGQTDLDLDLNLNLEEELPEENLFEEDEGFLDPRCDALSVGSVNEVKGIDCRSYVSAQGEFFDADEGINWLLLCNLIFVSTVLLSKSMRIGYVDLPKSLIN